MLSKLYGYLAGFAALVVAILAAWGIAKRSGVKEEKAAETERSLKETKEANEIDTAVHRMSDADLDAKLQSVRPPPQK